VRALFLLLALANAVFFAWARLVAPGGAGADPAPLARQISPEKLRVVRPEELARSLSPKSVAPAAPPAVPPAPPPAAPAAVKVKCFEWGSFSPAELARAQTALAPLALGERLSQRKTEETAGWWVFIPPQNGNARQAAARKAAELKKLGVQDYFIVQEEGRNHWALSLGVFRSEEAAQARLASLRARGVRSARLGMREMPVPKIWLQVKDVDAALGPKLQQIARGIDGTELRECVP
jgi:hypothetical protein